LRRTRPLRLRMRPGGWGISPRIASWLTLLPDPDSPDVPSVSPGKTSYVTAVDGVDDAVLGRELDDGGRESRGSAQARVRRWVGSRASRSPSQWKFDAEDDQHDRPSPGT